MEEYSSFFTCSPTCTVSWNFDLSHFHCYFLAAGVGDGGGACMSGCVYASVCVLLGLRVFICVYVCECVSLLLALYKIINTLFIHGGVFLLQIKINPLQPSSSFLASFYLVTTGSFASEMNSAHCFLLFKELQGLEDWGPRGWCSITKFNHTFEGTLAGREPKFHWMTSLSWIQEQN